jgi:hypothetical protein
LKKTNKKKKKRIVCNNFRVRGDGAAGISIWRRSVIEWLPTSVVAKKKRWLCETCAVSFYFFPPYRFP